MMAAAELAALRLQDFPSANHEGLETDKRGRVFRLLDKNGDGKISIDELMEVMEDLGAPGDDAREMMQLLDSNSDGFLSSDEFDLFQNQVHEHRYCCFGKIECESSIAPTKVSPNYKISSGSGNCRKLSGSCQMTYKQVST